jgi:hypothetical protein
MSPFDEKTVGKRQVGRKVILRERSEFSVLSSEKCTKFCVLGTESKVESEKLKVKSKKTSERKQDRVDLCLAYVSNVQTKGVLPRSDS